MCTKPLRIVNKKYRHLNVDTPNKYIYVPCGTCEECLRSRASSLYVRARFEYEECLRSGGIGFMFCLTYGTKLCPRFEFEGKTYKVFNKQHVIDFLKRLRVRLDRYYLKRYKILAPDFKYLITSEYGTDPTRQHLPHIHGNIFFRQPISPYIFRKCFVESTFNNRTNERVFGKILQCEPLLPEKGGIKYSAKYILKDSTYAKQNYIINELIRFTKDKIDQKFGIILFPQTAADDFHNKAIRSSSDYKKFVHNELHPFANMLQFYMLSNDLGVSAILNRYGENIDKYTCVNVDGFSYPFPKLANDRISETYGSRKSLQVSKTKFVDNFKKILSFLVIEKLVSQKRADELLDFVFSRVYFKSGKLVFKEVEDKLQDDFDMFDFSTLHKLYNFYEDNNFFSLRDDVLHCFTLYNSTSYLKQREKVAKEKTRLERDKYEQRKRNKNV